MSRKHKTIPGLSQKKLSIAKELGFSKSTLYEWRKTRPKLYEIIMQYYGIEKNQDTPEQSKK
ncbi:hypothetical protein CFVI02298_04420 [Campylobacter fetus subsp. venerealis cfvi02/298]|nr:hypothetical protein CFVI02298_04420 [Campylobacter fetus subsp. venerealis cfvi02/298]